MSTTRITHPPIVGEIQAIFATLPDEELLAKLRGPIRRGRPGFNPAILWRCYVVYYYLGLESVSDLIRLLRDNPYIAQACGINSPDEIPSQPTFSRFGARLATRKFAVTLRNVQRSLTRRLYKTLPGFGQVVAIDSTHMKGWSNASKKGKKKVGAIRRQKPKVGKVSDPDAGWTVKVNTEGRSQFTWGYKAHILCDAEYELPIVVDVSAGNVSDVRRASPLLYQARHTYSKFVPDYVLCDAGYSSDRLRQLIKRQFRATPLIDPHPLHKKAVAAQQAILEWKTIYNRRSAIERLNGRLKGFFKLDAIRVRGRMKVRNHATMAIMALQARALAFPAQMRECVRAVA
ncbi:MAG: transposase [Chloroflexi bacterium]|nr:transposase [Chloroflexota bacterium]